jgi:hypothetical protein
MSCLHPPGAQCPACLPRHEPLYPPTFVPSWPGETSPEQHAGGEKCTGPFLCRDCNREFIAGLAAKARREPVCRRCYGDGWEDCRCSEEPPTPREAELEARCAALEAELAEYKITRSTGKEWLASIATLTAERDAAEARAKEIHADLLVATRERSAFFAQVATLSAERDALAAQLAACREALEKALDYANHLTGCSCNVVLNDGCDCGCLRMSVEVGAALDSTAQAAAD